ncbi:MAG: 3-phosphoglycerate dehydrogenase, partial [Planctomycetes bacterium]|nr:3-phosphoglycerate dehydrogenase [Planctomycetota bacterium]
RLCSLEELLKQADIVSLHAPNTPDTYDLINARTLAMMKPGSVVVNTARGSLIDEDALYEALKSGHLLGAGLDVFKVEPLPADSPLVGLENIVLAPHMAGLDHESVEAMGRIAAQCIVEMYQGRWPEACVVNRELRPKWKW